MSINLSSNGRVSDLLRNSLLLASIRRGQTALTRAQEQLATGRRIQAASEDPVAASRIIDLNGLKARLDRFAANADYAKAFLATADAALADATDLLTEAHSLALASANAGASDSERAANGTLVNSLLDRLRRLANQQVQGRYLFDGAAGAGEPFAQTDGGVAYVGGRNTVSLTLDPRWRLDLALDGATIFGGESATARPSTDLRPTMVGATRLSDLDGATGQGVSLGAITVDDGVHPPATIDLSSAATVGDLIDLFNAAAPPGTTLSNVGDHLEVHSTAAGANLTIAEVGSGAVARDLGIRAAASGDTVAGLSTATRLTEQALLASLAGGAGIDQTGVTISNGSRSATIDLSSAVTIGDVLNALNGSGLGVRASVGPDGRGLVYVNTLSGGELRISEAGGATAADLGLRTFHGGLELSALNAGLGLDRAGQGLDDLRIAQRDGHSFDVSLYSARTIDDVIDAINNAPGNTGTLVASISGVGGIELKDNSADGGFQLTVASLNQSAAADQLGIAGQTGDDMLCGPELGRVRTEGAFAALIGLRQALADNDLAGISRYAGLIQQSLDYVIQARGALGAQAADVEQQITHLADGKLACETMLSEVRDLDYAEAVVRFNQLQTQLQASLAAAGRLLNLSLLDFLAP